MMKAIKEAMSLKRFMLRSEVIKLYRNSMKIGRLIEQLNKNQSGPVLRKEWEDWVRTEFRLRQEVTDENVIQNLLNAGSRQVKEMERTIRLANN